MGYWGVKSYENDDAGDALDAGFDRVHGSAYEDLMDDRNAMTVDQVHKKLANPDTLAASLAWLGDEFGDDQETWDEIARLAFVGVVVRHKEMGVPIPEESRLRALNWLQTEDIDWEEETLRGLRRQREIALLGGPA
ncbi:MAG: hypothetical protein JWN86_2010 [Planctomycetota bacterium]|nr:hypothetical protein [Planctomycetota bacterium]